jgi:uncharacterized protein (DUF1330 family)
MSTYLFTELEVTNPAGFQLYREAVGDILAEYGGRFLVRRGATRLLEGGPEPKVIAIIEFPDTGAFDRFWNSPEYRAILPNRLENSTGRVFVVEGVTPA